MFRRKLLARLESGSREAILELRKVQEQIMVKWLPQLKSRSAREYLTHGVGRRLRVLQRSLENVFTLCPVRQTEPLSEDARTDVEINIHAFVINVHGLLDDLAWVTVFEGCMGRQLPPRNRVGLFDQPQTEKHLSKRARRFLGRPRILRWYKRYADNFRDALVHRIAPYIPPTTMGPAEAKKAQDLEDQIIEAIKKRDIVTMKALQEAQDKLGTFLPIFIHSYRDTDRAPPILFHPRLIADAKRAVASVRVVSPVRLEKRGAWE